MKNPSKKCVSPINAYPQSNNVLLPNFLMNLKAIIDPIKLTTPMNNVPFLAEKVADSMFSKRVVEKISTTLIAVISWNRIWMMLITIDRRYLGFEKDS